MLSVSMLLIACEEPAQEVESTGDRASQRSEAPEERRIVVPISENEDYAFVWVGSGSFEMGNSYEGGLEAIMAPSQYPSTESPVHRVTLTRDYYIGQYPVTVSQYCVFLNDAEVDSSGCIGYYFDSGHPISIIDEDDHYAPRAGCEDFPIHFASWSGAVKFAAWLDKKTEHDIRLPTEAEWEFAARGPKGRLHPWGDTMPLPKDQYVFERRIPDPDWLTKPVGSHPANQTPDGVFDMVHGGLEWVSDLYSDYSKEPRVDPTGPAVASESYTGLRYRVVRGSYTPRYYATHRGPRQETRGAGFRLVLVPRDDE